MTKTESEASREGQLQSKLTPAPRPELSSGETIKVPKASQPDAKTAVTQVGSSEPAAQSKEDIKPILKSLPEILKGVAAVVTAVGGIITVLLTAGIIGQKSDTQPLPDTLVVVSTTPEDGASNVDASMSELVIVFNQPVNQERWSFVVTEQGEFPEMAGDPTFRDEETCVLSVKLEAGKTYSVGVNSPTHQNFVAAADETIIAEPYQFSFSTKP